jgi:uncharacterized protein
MTFGLGPEQWAIIKEKVIEPLKAEGAEVFIYGSRARGDYQKFSDIDILYREKTPIAPKQIAKIKLELEEGTLPVKVDLVNWLELADEYKPIVEKEKVAAI